MRQATLAILTALLTLVVGISSQALTQSPRQPDASRGLLIQKHRAAGVKCAGCHAESPPSKAPQTAACAACHGNYSQIATKTSNVQPNPHASHMGEVPCDSCHHLHKPSVLYCNQCHTFDLTPP
jgi:fumarate reductase flavoprotein subunit